LITGAVTSAIENAASDNHFNTVLLMPSSRFDSLDPTPKLFDWNSRAGRNSPRRRQPALSSGCDAAQFHSGCGRFKDSQDQQIASGM
jgi:hypothetical protein